MGVLNGGDPPRRYYAARMAQRQIHEMLGMVRGLVCDGVLNDEEILAFRSWLGANPDVTACWPGRDLATRVLDALEDGRIDAGERHELYELFCDTAGDGGEGSMAENLSTQLPLDQPPPTVMFDGHTFCLTGGFVYGPRGRCEQAIRDRGGKCGDNVTTTCSYLVIGTLASEAWVQGAWGRKIETAVAARGKGWPVKIINEGRWADAMAIDR